MKSRYLACHVCTTSGLERADSQKDSDWRILITAFRSSWFWAWHIGLGKTPVWPQAAQADESPWHAGGLSRQWPDIMTRNNATVVTAAAAVWHSAGAADSGVGLRTPGAVAAWTWAANVLDSDAPPGRPSGQTRRLSSFQGRNIVTLKLGANHWHHGSCRSALPCSSAWQRLQIQSPWKNWQVRSDRSQP